MIAGCVIPIGPEFQDPVHSPEYAPVLVDQTPAFGSIVTVDLRTPQQFIVLASDLNPGDELYWEWVLDYPPYVQGTTQAFGEGYAPAPASGPQVHTITQRVGCEIGPNPNGPTQHQLKLIVGDKPLTYDAVMMKFVATGGKTDEGNWTVTLACPLPGSS